MSIHNIIKLLLSVFMLVCTSVDANDRSASRGYTFGVFPYLTSDHMYEIYSPLNDRLNEALQSNSKFTTESSHRKFIHKLNNEVYDFALIPPFWYPVAVDKKNYIALLKMKEPFSALVVTLDESAIHSIKDLKGKLVATPPVFAPVVSLAISEMVKHGMVPSIDFKLQANETADACLRKVIEAKASACITPPYVPLFMEKHMQVKFRTVLTSSSIPSVSLVVHSRVADSDREKIKNVFEELAQTDKGRSILEIIQTKGFIPINDAEFDIVRHLLENNRPLH